MLFKQKNVEKDLLPQSQSMPNDKNQQFVAKHMTIWHFTAKNAKNFFSQRTQGSCFN